MSSIFSILGLFLFLQGNLLAQDTRGSHARTLPCLVHGECRDGNIFYFSRQSETIIYILRALLHGHVKREAILVPIVAAWYQQKRAELHGK